MMQTTKYLSLAIIVSLISLRGVSQTVITSEENKEPVSYATISFGNGYGTFADEEGKFFFSEKLYPNIDSLFISALGFKEQKFASNNLPKEIIMFAEPAELDEVFINVLVNRDYDEETLKPYVDSDYYKSWLPTIESEIAVYFENNNDELKKITMVHLPLTLESKDWKKRKRANSEKKPFSTLFKVKFYNNDNGSPGKALTNDVIVFRATEKMGDYHTLNVDKNAIMIPKSGVFVSIQVLGYTDKAGKLLPNKKYKEIKSGSGIVRIPTNFRPLLPFTDKIESDRTFIKRVFISGNEWVKFNKENVSDSSLLKSGLNNYGMGLTFNSYKNE